MQTCWSLSGTINVFHLLELENVTVWLDRKAAWKITLQIVRHLIFYTFLILGCSPKSDKNSNFSEVNTCLVTRAGQYVTNNIEAHAGCCILYLKFTETLQKSQAAPWCDGTERGKKLNWVKRWGLSMFFSSRSLSSFTRNGGILVTFALSVQDNVPQHLLVGTSLGRVTSHVTAFTDVSLSGCGGTCLVKALEGVWPPTESSHSTPPAAKG